MPAQRCLKSLYNFLALTATLSAIAFLLLRVDRTSYSRSYPPPRSSSSSSSSSSFSSSSPPRYAYATFLGPRTPSQLFSSSSSSDDPYFTSVRLLTYQLLHSSRTRTRLDPAVPFLVLTHPAVPASQLSALASVGATIVPVAPLDLPSSFVNDRTGDMVSRSRFRNVLAKLRVFQLTAYDKILCLDADTLLLAPLDTLFTDPLLGVPTVTLPPRSSDDDESPPLPPSYLLSATADTWGNQSDWLASPSQPSLLCACFMLLGPSARLFAYYEWILGRPDAAFDAMFPDQDLLIYAHRETGRMPWRKVGTEWSANDAGMMGSQGGVRSLHVKAWKGADGANLGGERLEDLWGRLVREMEEFFRERTAR